MTPLAACAVGVLFLAGCGNGSRQATTSTASKYDLGTKAQGAIGNVTPPKPQPKGRKVDPDSLNMGGADVEWTIAAAGNGRYVLRVTNTSRIGYVDAIKWSPPVGDAVQAVEGSSFGNCTLADGAVACEGLHLKPPKCLCRPGGSATITIRLRSKNPGRGFMRSALQVVAMSPVPYVIPSTPGEASNKNQ
jgi:hypothetical protein